MKIQCTHCPQQYEVSSGHLGKTVTCQTCGKSFVVTNPATDTQNLLEKEQKQVENLQALMDYYAQRSVGNERAQSTTQVSDLADAQKDETRKRVFTSNKSFPRNSPITSEDGCMSQSALRIVTMSYAGFWKRAVASFIDGIIFCPVTFFCAGIQSGTICPTITGDHRFLLIQVISIVTGWLYCALFESSSKQATLGKMAVGIKVTDMNGNRISFGRASGRHFAKFLSSLIGGIGWIMAAFTQKKQGLHDIVAKCLVVISR